ncbi:restriction endonuclease subunit S [Aeromonas veronii]|uniref:restriction endonuclease subunit S n=1 Tax=Aeromonas veronii TaxID=654 RepID=UPI00192023B8|nr:restriction endonuclease subunit S [Aeromonas veronii]MBL0639085.1 restriction endonuclease subunit S [Aeromonas veronii]
MVEQMMQGNASEIAATQTIPAGYKQTDVGVIPEDWEVVCLGDIGQSLIGLTYSPKDVSDDGVLVLRSSNVQNGRLAYEDSVFVKMELPDRVIVKDGDILICVRNGSRQLIGKCALIDKIAQGFAFGAFMTVYRTKASGFVFYQFQSDVIQSQINETMGATINQITNRDLSGFKIMIPNSILEQTTIANVLSDTDALIGALEQLIAKKQAIKTASMQQLLTGRTRLPQFALRPDGTPKGYKTSELGQIPEDWFVVAMNQLIEKNSKITYGVIQPGKNDPAGVLFVRGGDIFDGVVNVEALRKISPSISTSYKKTILQGGELIISLVGYPGECAIVPKSLAGANIARQVALVRFSSTEVGLHHFICHFLRSPFGKKILLKETFGSAQQVINLKDVNRLELSIPSSHQEQTAIATILSDMDNELNALEQKLAKARDVKQGMMQQLLTGRIRLPLEVQA